MRGFAVIWHPLQQIIDLVCPQLLLSDLSLVVSQLVVTDLHMKIPKFGRDLWDGCCLN